MAYMDFEYDGQYLSDYDCIIAFVSGDGGITTESAGSKITFDKVPFFNGKQHRLHGAKYEETISISFEICKNPEKVDNIEITNDEFRDLMRWLNRREFLSFSFIGDNEDDELSHIYYGSFNVDKILTNGRLIGLKCVLTTDSAFAEGQEQYYNWTISDANQEFKFTDLNDEIGITYPRFEIDIMRNGDLHIYNETTDTSTQIKNCVVGEKIVIDGKSQVITTNKAETHKLNDDFNFVFPIVENTIDNRINKLRFNLPCKVKITYKPKLR